MKNVAGNLPQDRPQMYGVTLSVCADQYRQGCNTLNQWLCDKQIHHLFSLSPASCWTGKQAAGSAGCYINLFKNDKYNMYIYIY